MPTIAATGSSTANAVATPEVSRVPQKQLGQNDFLKLLATQFKTQDPMKPVEDTAFIAQMAQFTALQQANTMAQTMTAMRTEQMRATATSYLGRSVTLDLGKGSITTGNVEAVDA